MLEEGLAKNPDPAKAAILAGTDRETFPKPASLPGPMLSLGIPNDGFNRIQVEQMESTYDGVRVPPQRGLMQA